MTESDHVLREILKSIHAKKGSPVDPIDCMVLGAKFGMKFEQLLNETIPPDESEPVRMEDGSVENFTVRKTNGTLYRCSCGANVFHKPDRENLDIYRCNGCGKEFEAE